MVRPERKDVLKSMASAFVVASLLLAWSPAAEAFAGLPNNRAMQQRTGAKNTDMGVGSPSHAYSRSVGALDAVAPTVAYRAMHVKVGNTDIPVALWYPTMNENHSDMSSGDDIIAMPLSYNHRISVRRIGQLLAGWDFIPDFASKNFQLSPTMSSMVTTGESIPLPSKGPVVLLAHGYLGSRFDLSHLAEALAQEGFICVSAEYPESLAASYDRIEGLDREVITNQLLMNLQQEWGIQPTSYGIVGHSLGTGTALSTGDSSWARVCIAGFPRRRDGSEVSGNVLFVSSMNDGAVSPARMGGKAAIPSNIAMLDEYSLGSSDSSSLLPPRATLLFDRPDGPNHISFLADEVNEAMIDLLSPLLPVAKAFNIPVLDFDKYKESRDSKETADVVIPLVARYLKQQMRVQITSETL